MTTGEVRLEIISELTQKIKPKFVGCLNSIFIRFEIEGGQTRVFKIKAYNHELSGIALIDVIEDET